MGCGRFELPTPCLSSKCSKPTELTPRYFPMRLSSAAYYGHGFKNNNFFDTHDLSIYRCVCIVLSKQRNLFLKCFQELEILIFEVRGEDPLPQVLLNFGRRPVATVIHFARVKDGYMIRAGDK